MSVVHRIMAEDANDTVYFAKTSPKRFIIELHTKRGEGIRVSFTELDEAGAKELMEAIRTCLE